MRFYQFVVSMFLASLVPGVGVAQSSPDQAREKLEKWIEVHAKIAAEKAAWAEDKEILGATADLLKAEKEALKKEIETLSESNSEADNTRNELLLKRAELKRADDEFAKKVVELEAAVVALGDKLPKPLKNKLETLLVRIPADPENSPISLGQRLVNVLGIMLQTEKFDGTVTYAGAKQKLSDGREVQMDQLYWGLAFAVYVDDGGSVAGFGLPTDSGWDFQERNEIAPQVRRLLDIYEGNTDAIEFVSIPVDLK